MIKKFSLKKIIFALITALSILIIIPSLFFPAKSPNGETSLKLFDQFSVSSKTQKTVAKFDNFDGTASINSEGIITLETILPDYSNRYINGTTLMLRTSQQNTKIYLEKNDGDIKEKSLIYSFGYNEKPVFGKTMGSAYHFVRLPIDYINQTLIIEIENPYSYKKTFVNSVYIGTKASNIFLIMKKYIPGTIAGTIMVLLGLMELFTFAATSKTSKKSNVIMYLSQFSILAGIWVISENRIIQLMFHNTFAISMMGIIAFYLLPIPFIFFMIENKYIKNDKIIKCVTNTLLGFIVIAMFLQIISAVDLYELVSAFHIILIATVAILLVKSFTMVPKSPHIKLFFVALGTLAATAVLDLVCFYFNVFNSASTLSQCGLVAFILLMIAIAIKDYIEMTNSLAVNVVLQKQAYTDTMTGTKNRTSFDEQIEEINCNDIDIDGLAILVADINNLKKINDTYGHRKGDIVIKQCADILKKSFDEIAEVYRIGGDEFAIIFRGVDKDKCNRAVENMNNLVNIQRKKENEFPISLSYGLDFYDPISLNNVTDIFNSADKKMYEIKTTSKLNNTDDYSVIE